MGFLARASGALVAAMLVLVLGAGTAFADTNERAGHTDWNDWSFDWEVSSLYDGVSLQNVHFQGREIISRASQPVMRVYYDNSCGPYSDRIGGELYEIPWTDGFEVAHRTYTRDDGSEWLEIGIYDRLGSYKIYQAWYLSADGILDAHMFSSGLQCNIDHRHYPYWRLDFDLDGAGNDRIEQLNGTTWQPQATEFDATAERAHRVVDPATGTSVRVLSGPGDWGLPGEQTQASTAGAEHGVFGRLAENVPVGDYRSIYTSGDEASERPASTGADILGEDVALIYRARMGHLSSEGSTLWHSSGPRFIVDIAPPNGVPSAVAGADRTSGTAPLGIRFSAAGSTDPDGDALSYAWDFGDGATASGVSPTHAYTSPGRYDATVTVSDGDGGSDSSSVSVVVAAANGVPTAVASATPASGAAPLAVGFSAAGSTDPDGDALSYAWDFTSDGSADATGPTASHAYPIAGTYLATLTVSDRKGGRDTATTVVSVSPAPSGEPTAAGQIVGEAGRVTARQSGRSRWHRVQLDHNYRDPVVVMGPITRRGAQPVVARVRKVTARSFEYKIDEWNYLDGRHARESVGYLVMERGVHTLADGRVVEAGRTSANHNWRRVPIRGDVGTAPVVLAQVAGNSGRESVVARLRATRPRGFQVSLQEQESSRRSGHRRERLDWIALEAGGGDAAVARTGDVVTHRPRTIRVNVARRPVLLGSLLSNDGADTAAVRLRRVARRSFSVYVEEERSADREVRHTAEIVGWAAFPSGPLRSRG